MTRPADSRAMYGVHQIFRREFTNLPVLIREVADGDRARVAVVADHLDFLIVFLHDHHHAEDEHVWPKLVQRVSTELEPLVRTMEAQHRDLDRVLTDLTATSARWRATASASERDGTAAAADQVIAVLFEHLVLEEREVLPLIDEHLTHEEWQVVGETALKGLPKDKLPVSFGMALYEAGPSTREIMKAEIPRVPWAIFSRVGPRAYSRYAKRIYGTGHPPKFGEVTSGR
jgi:hemerythrin-like domain-containing protein